MRFPLVRVSLIALMLGLGLSACGNPDSSRADLTTMLTERAELTDDQAGCIADAIFGGEFSQDEINKGSLDPASVEGFQQAIDDAIVTCLPSR
jgi:hypothetical protein